MRIFIIVVVAILSGCATAPGLPCTSAEIREHSFLKRLVRRESIPEAEARHDVRGVPFGALASEWARLKNQMAPGDQLWWFEREDGVALQGALEGYVVLRGCEIVDRLVIVTD